MPSEAKPFWSALTFGAVDIAQQLTVISAERLRQVTPGALANISSWVAEEGKAVTGDSPVKLLIDWTNQVGAPLCSTNGNNPAVRF